MYLPTTEPHFEPTEPMTTPLPTVDLYGSVHKGLRWALTSMLTRLGTLDAKNPRAIWQLVDDLDGVLFLCASHVAHEERSIHPVLAARRPGALSEAEEEHVHHLRDIEHLRALADALADGPGEKAPLVARALYLRFATFVAETFVHMDHEEMVLQPLLESLLTRDELERLHDDIVGSIGPEEMAAFMRVMIPANDPETRAAMLSGAREAMPAAAFIDMLQSYRSVLSSDDWADLGTRLGVLA